jgi:hypothetical protein
MEKREMTSQVGHCFLAKEAWRASLLNLRTHNSALLTRDLFRCMNKQDILWVNLGWQAHYSEGNLPHSTNTCGSFWWRDNLSLLIIFLYLASYDGATVRLWLENRCDSLRDKFTHFFLFAKD